MVGKGENAGNQHFLCLCPCVEKSGAYCFTCVCLSVFLSAGLSVHNVIHDIISTADPIPYTAKFMFDGVRNNKTQQIRRRKLNRTCI